MGSGAAVVRQKQRPRLVRVVGLAGVIEQPPDIFGFRLLRALRRVVGDDGVVCDPPV